MGWDDKNTATGEKKTITSRLVLIAGGLLTVAMLTHGSAQQSQSTVNEAAIERALLPVVPTAVTGQIRDSLDSGYVQRWRPDTRFKLRDRNYFKLDPQAVRERAARIVADVQSKNNAVADDSARALMVLTRANGEKITIIVESEVDMNKKTWLRDAYPPNSRIYRCYLKEDRRVMFNVEIVEGRIRFNGWIAVPNRQPGSNLAFRLVLIEGSTHALVELELPFFGE